MDVQAKLVELRKVVKDLRGRLVLSMSIIEEIQDEEKVQNIWGIRDLTPAVDTDGGEKKKKKKKEQIRTMLRMLKQPVFSVSWTSK